MGSSLKLCLLAEGKADLYPRLGPTSEWDIAAADAVLAAAGGAVRQLNGTPLAYNKRNLLNPDFIAVADAAFPWRRSCRRTPDRGATRIALVTEIQADRRPGRAQRLRGRGLNLVGVC